MIKSCDNCRKKKKCSRAGEVTVCYLHSDSENRKCHKCGASLMIEEHHIYGAANRKRSDRDGLTVDLCANCHRNDKDSAHASGKYSEYLHKIGQIVYEQTYGDGSFLKEYGRNYI